MKRTRVKICGIGRPEDALAAARAGADAIGMIFHPAARRVVSLESAGAILAVLPPYVTPVGLFVNATVDEILRITATIGLRHIQLHGDEPPTVAAALPNCAIVKAIRVDEATLADDLVAWKSASSNVRGIVLETAHTGQAGGSGKANDWTAVRRAMDRGLFDGCPPIVAAGGLNPGNVAEVIRSIRPWAVDVSSGVEQTYGQKSEALIEGFVAAVRAADCD